MAAVVRGDPQFLYPSAPRERSTLERVAHAIRWRVSRLTSRMPPLLRIIRELRTATDRSSLAIGADLVSARLNAGIRPLTFVANLMWEVPKERWGDFVSGAEIGPFFAATIDPQDRLLIRDKAAFADHDRQLGMPWLPTLVIVNRHETPSIEGAVAVSDRSVLVSTLDRFAEAGDLFLKPSCAKQGRGAYRYRRGRSALDADGGEVPLADLVEGVFAYRHPDGDYGYVVQRAIEPHPELVELTGVEVLSTLRLVTAFRDGATHVLQALLKVPAPGRVIDNFVGGVTGTMLAGVDPSSGRLSNLVGILHPGHRLVCERTSTHPVTGRRIAGRELPRWREAVDLARRAALLHPRTATLGWDIALTPSGWVFLDVNVMWGPSGSQVCTGQGMRPVLAKLFPEHW